MNRYIALVLTIGTAAILAGCGIGSGGAALPPDPTVEATALVAVADSSGIQLTWVASADEYAVGSKVYFSTDGGTTYDTGGTDVSAAQSYTFDGTDFTFGTNYTFKVTTYNSAGAESSGVTTPEEVSDLAVLITGGDAALSWTSSSDAAEYMVYYSSDGGAAFDAGTSAGTDTDITLANVVGSGGYIFKVVVLDALTSDANISAGATTPLDITNFIASAGDTLVTLTWTASASLDVDGYKVYVKEGSGSYDSGTSVGAVITYDVTSLTNGTTYTIKVTAVDANGDESSGPYSMVIPTSANDVTPPTDGAELQGTPGDTKVALDWNPAADGVISYNIYVGGVLEVPPSPLNIASLIYTVDGFPAYTVTGLTNGTLYTFRVTALDSRGNESVGITVTATPGLDSVKCTFALPGGVYNWGGAPQNVNITGSENGTIWYTVDKSNPQIGVSASWVYTAGNPLVISVSDNVTIKTLLVGGVSGAGITTPHRYLIYNNAAFPANRYKQFSGMMRQRRYPTAHRRIGGTVIFIGGINPNTGAVVTPCEYYDDQDEYFLLGGNQPTAFRDHRSATLLDDTTVIACGGRTAINPSTAVNTACMNPQVRGTCNANVDINTIDDAGVADWTAAAVVVGDFVTITSGTAQGARAKITVVAVGELTTENFSTAPSNGDTYVIGYNFIATGVMGSPRFYHTATRLYNGRILITGGISPGGDKTGGGATTTDTGAGMIKDGLAPWATVVVGDVVEFAAGIGLVSKIDMTTTPPQISLLGYSSDILPGTAYAIYQGSVNTAELYNAGAFGAAGGTMNLSRFGHTATFLEDGRVFIAGGIYDYARDVDDDREFMTELYDPDDDDFEWAGFGNSADLTTERSFHAATRLKDGRVLITGGLAAPVGVELFGNLYTTTPTASAEIFDPTTETMFDIGTMTTPRFLHTSTLLLDGKVLITGGIISAKDGNKRVYTDSAEVYDPSTGEFTAVDMLLEPRFGHAAELLEDGNVLIGGGLNTNLPELFLPGRNSFVATASCMSGDRFVGSTATLLDDGDNTTNENWEDRVFVAGGQRKHTVDSDGDDTEGNYLSTAETYDSNILEFVYTTSSMANKRREHTATRLDDGDGATHPAWEGKVLIAGGYNADGGLIGAELYDPVADFDDDTLTPAFSSVGSMSAVRYGHTATLLTDDTVLVTGGGSVVASLKTADIYDPATELFSTTTGNMNFGRFHHAAILLNDGRVLITGGQNSFDKTAETYNTATKQFTALVAQMNWGRDGHDMALLPGGDVLIVGGEVADANVEVFDVGTDTFIAVTDTMVIGHYGHTVTSLLDGASRILISSGDNNGTGEYFTYTGNPATSFFGLAFGGDGDDTIVLDGTQPWEYHSAIRLPNGSVLLFWEHVAQVFFPN